MTPDIEATYRIVTPAFIGGADNRNTAELRLPSIKGALRFWWRTLAWSRIGNDVEKLWEEEAYLFGSSDQQVGQSKVMLRLKDARTEILTEGTRLAQANSGLAYLGYGLMPGFGQQAGQITRPAIKAGGTFTIAVRFSGPLAETTDENKQLKKEVEKAVVLLGLVGGLGSRCRRGWGSLTITQLRTSGVETAVSDLTHYIPNDFTCAEETPLWTAWSGASKVREIKCNPSSTDALATLDKFARELVRFRCWGFSQNNHAQPRVLSNIPSESNFADDHDLVKREHDYSDPPYWDRNPERIAFGLPHNYYTTVRGLANNHKIPITVEPENEDRRASPLLIHVHQKRDQDHAVVRLVFLPSLFLPGRTPTVTYCKKNHHKRDAPIRHDNFWWPIEAFFDRLDGIGPVGRPYEYFLPEGAANTIKERLSVRSVR